MYTYVNTIVWNCRGMGSRNTRLYKKELVKTHKSAIFVTLETRIHSSIVFDFLVNSSFNDIFVIEALSYSGGIWLLWNANMVSIEVLAATDQAVTTLVTKLDGHNWLHTVVHASQTI